MASTKVRSFRISDEIYNQAKAKAEAEETSVTAVIVRLLSAYVGS
jgi:hypothetical protein